MTVSEATPEPLIATLDNHNGLRYHPSMIKSFKDEEAARLFRRQFSRKLPQDIQRIARRKLEILDGAETLQDLRIPPANRLEQLSGDREGQYSIRINDQWRICFEWRDSDVYNAEIVDYH
jgi:toxin HigB-1